MRTFKQLLDRYNDKDILLELARVYPDQKPDSYVGVLNQLRTMKPTKSDMVIVPRKFSTSGIVGSVEYGIEFTKWQKWLDSPVKTKKKGITALCYCLWEMTFMGFEQKEIQGTIKKLDKLVTSSQKDK